MPRHDAIAAAKRIVAEASPEAQIDLLADLAEPLAQYMLLDYNGDGERAVPPSRWKEHGGQDARRRRTGTVGCSAAWALYGRGEGGAAGCPGCSR
jgi:hypothetical protein